MDQKRWIRDDQIEKMKMNEKYRNQEEIAKIMQDLEEIDKFKMTLKHVVGTEDRSKCAICLDIPMEKVFVCQECDNWICGQCLNRVTICPHCREDLRKRPMIQSKALERVLTLRK